MHTPSDRPAADPSSSLLETRRAWSATHSQATFAEIEMEAAHQVAALRTELIRTALATRDPATGRTVRPVAGRWCATAPAPARSPRVRPNGCRSSGTAIAARPTVPSFSLLGEALDLGPSGYSPWLVEGAVPAGEACDRTWQYLATRRAQIAYRDFNRAGLADRQCPRGECPQGRCAGAAQGSGHTLVASGRRGDARVADHRDERALGGPALTAPHGQTRAGRETSRRPSLAPLPASRITPFHHIMCITPI